MLSQLSRVLVLVFIATMSSFAIIGFGGHYAPSLGGKVEGGTYDIASGGGNTVQLVEKDGSPLQGAGVKVWIDALPFIDLEVAGNIQFVTYDASLEITGAVNKSVPLSIDPNLPIFSPTAKPVFGRGLLDFSVRYPFLKLPPIVKILTLSVGAGYSQVWSKKVLSKETVSSIVTPSEATSLVSDNAIDNLTQRLVDDLTDKNTFDTGSGFHLLLGAKVKLPVIPIAVYLDGKLYLGGGLPDNTSSGFTLQMGGGLNF